MKTSTSQILHCIPGKRCRVLPRTPAAGDKTKTPVTAQFPGGLAKILVPVDFSPRSQQALDYALSLATEYKAQIILLYAAEPVPLEMDYGYGPVNREFSDPSLVKKTAAQLKAFGKNHVPACHLGDVVVHSGKPAKEIVKVARDVKAGCIVICTHCDDQSGTGVACSVASEVIHQAPCPVVVLREE